MFTAEKTFLEFSSWHSRNVKLDATVFPVMLRRFIVKSPDVPFDVVTFDPRRVLVVDLIRAETSDHVNLVHVHDDGRVEFWRWNPGHRFPNIR